MADDRTEYREPSHNLTPFPGAVSNNAVWRHLKPQLAALLERQRKRLENDANSSEQTASIRGQCRLLRSILAMEMSQEARASYLSRGDQPPSEV